MIFKSRNKILLRDYCVRGKERLFKLYKKYQNIFGKTQYIQEKRIVL